MSDEGGRLRELALLFGKLGAIGFGGPAAHIALMRDEVVDRKRWVDRQRFLDLVGATNLIPGPNSTELAIHIGRDRAGWRGLLVAGTAFIVPSMVIVLVLAWLYVEHGRSPTAESLLYAIGPVVIAIVVVALTQLARTAARSPLMMVLMAATFILFLMGVHELLLLAGAAVLATGTRIANRSTSALLPLLVSGGVPSPSLPEVFGLFLKFGSVVFGSGYVLLAFLRADLVDRLGWITNQQLLDAVAIGQMTPGPVFTTATFIGYLVAGTPGALIATVGIFLPGFALVGFMNPLVTKMRESNTFSAALDGLNAAAVGLMAGVTVQLAGHALTDGLAITIALVAFLVLLRWRVNAAWLILGAAMVGLARTVLL